MAPKKPPASQLAAEFAKRLAKERRRLGYTSKAAFARVLGLAPPTYRRYERAEIEPSLDVLHRLYRIAHLSLETLIIGQEPDRIDPSPVERLPSPKAKARR